MLFFPNTRELKSKPKKYMYRVNKISINQTCPYRTSNKHINPPHLFISTTRFADDWAAKGWIEPRSKEHCVSLDWLVEVDDHAQIIAQATNTPIKLDKWQSNVISGRVICDSRQTIVFSVFYICSKTLIRGIHLMV